MAKNLTRRQQAILEFIVEYLRENRVPPSIIEIGTHFNLASTNGVKEHLDALERKGYIERTSKARSIRLTRKSVVTLVPQNVVMLPLVGRIAAGQPLLAEENIEGQLPVSRTVAGSGSYCLRVHGDSMIEASILDRDMIIVNPELRATPGDIVVALIEDEATVKYFYPNGDTVELRPANRMMQSLLVPAATLQLQGVVVGLYRTMR